MNVERLSLVCHEDVAGTSIGARRVEGLASASFQNKVTREWHCSCLLNNESRQRKIYKLSKFGCRLE